jgi:hypothetical protein
MKSLTIYLDEDDYEKIKQITEKRRMGLSQFYRELTQVGISMYNDKEIKLAKNFCGIPENF